MSEFMTPVTPLKNKDSFKRVNYPIGMLLTPAEFFQEQYYFLERDRLHNRLLHGHGTVCGLNVSVQDNDKISVSEGFALDMHGRLIRVEKEQCVSLKEWLKKYSEKFSQASPPAPVPDSLYIVLCYHECLSDKVLIRTSPCQPKDQSEAYSRVQESFELKLATEPPDQFEEEAMRALGDLFAEIQVSSGAARLGPTELQEARTKIGSLVSELGLDISPPAVSSPPHGFGQALHPADAEILFRHAFKVWVTEVKPKLLPDHICAGSSDEKACVLLAEIGIEVDPQTWQITDVVTIDESQRPFNVSNRLIQEYMLNRFQAASVGAYQIAAAGRFDFQGNAIGPVYNELKATQVGSQQGVFTLTFSGYSNPDAAGSQHSYIVKGIAEATGFTFQVVTFFNTGIRIKVQKQPGPAPAQLPNVMIEISLIGSV